MTVKNLEVKKVAKKVKESQLKRNESGPETISEKVKVKL